MVPDIGFMDNEHRNKVPSRENLIDMARNVSDLAEKLDAVCERVAKSCESIEVACADLVGVTERVKEVRMSLFGIRAFLAREAAFGDYR